jgi:hypothetical protein
MIYIYIYIDQPIQIQENTGMLGQTKIEQIDIEDIEAPGESHHFAAVYLFEGPRWRFLRQKGPGR